MQIVIDIPQDVYDIMQVTQCVIQGHKKIVDKAILNGVVLPEHHGRLIDADRIMKEDLDCNKDEIEAFICTPCWKGCDSIAECLVICNAPTVLEGVE